MQGVQRIFAAVPLSAPPMLYRSPSRPSWDGHILRMAADGVGSGKNPMYVMASLAPKTYASNNLAVLSQVLEYASHVAAIREKVGARTLFTAENPSTWFFVSSDDASSVGVMQAGSLDEEFFAAAYNAATACVQASIVMYTRRSVAGVMENIMRLLLVAQNILRCLHETRQNVDPVDGGLVLIEEGALSRPVHLEANALDVLTTFTHAQMAEMQLIANARGDMGPGDLYHLQSAYGACRSALETYHRQPDHRRFSVVRNKMRRLAACKRHIAGAGAAYKLSQSKDLFAVTGAVAAHRFAEDARKSINKTRIMLALKEERENFNTDPLLLVREILANEINFIVTDTAPVLETNAGSASTNLANVGAQLALEGTHIAHLLDEPSNWTPSNFSKSLATFSIRCRDILAPNTALVLGPEAVLAFFDGRETPDVETVYVPDVATSIKRIYLLHEGFVTLQRDVEAQPSDDSKSHLEACRQAMIHMMAMAKLILFTEFHVSAEIVLLFGKYFAKDKDVRDIILPNDVCLRSDEEAVKYVPILDEVLRQVRDLITRR